MKTIEVFEGKGKICEDILRSLPSWFNDEESLMTWVVDVEKSLFFATYDGDRPIAFISLKEHFPETYEIDIMAVYSEYHRRGIGKELLEFSGPVLKKLGVKFLQVKTISESREDIPYDKTRAFYLRSGFTPIEEFKELWGEEYPCLLLIIAL